MLKTLTLPLLRGGRRKTQNPESKLLELPPNKNPMNAAQGRTNKYFLFIIVINEVRE